MSLQPKGQEKDTPSYKVKNTFLEYSIPGEDGKNNNTHKRRSRSDMTGPGMPIDPRLSPLVVASKSPHCSPALGPSDDKLQAVPIDEVNFELLEESAFDAAGACAGTDSRSFQAPAGGGAAPGEMVAQSNAGLGREEPAYVVPTTPSPFLHSAFPPSTMVPPFGTYGYGMPDMGLPPAFAEGEEGAEGVNFDLQGVEGQFMQGMTFIPPEMYDGTWATDADGNFVPADGAMGYAWAGWPPMPTDGGEGFGTTGDQAQDMALGLVGADGDYSREDGTPAGEKGKASAAEKESAERDERPTKESGRRGKGRNREQREEERAERRGRDAGGDHAEGSRREERGGRGEGGGAAASGGGNAAHEAGDVPDKYTTVMLRNIPNKYTREMLIKQLSVDFYGLFDFMYLPIDFKNKCNVGYAFINFRTPEACKDFVGKFHGVDVRKCLPGLNSKKIVEVTPARVQGLSENVRRLRNSPVMNQLQDHPEWMPLLFNKAGDEEPFPMPDTALPPVKPRGRNREAKNDG